MNRSEGISQLATALAAAQGEIRDAIKRNLIVTEKSRRNYADIASIREACREPLSKNGLSVVQLPERGESGIVLRTILFHKSGEFIESEFPPLTPAATQNMTYIQSLGSHITYARKYALMAMVGIAPDDDNDGETATATAAIPEEAQKTNGKTPRDPEAEARERGLIIANTERWLAEHGIASTRDARLYVASKLLDREIPSYNVLTPQEAAQVLNMLGKLADASIAKVRAKFPPQPGDDISDDERYGVDPFKEIVTETEPAPANVGPGH